MRPAASRAPRGRAAGFTLIEIAVVVALIGIMLAAGLKIAGALLENAAVTTTQKRQQAIKDALIAYLGRNQRLPCPDTGTSAGAGANLGPGPTVASPPDGRENRAALNGALQPDPATACAAAYGTVPFVDLGLPRDAALDGWQNLFGYQIVTQPANPIQRWPWNVAAGAGVVPGSTALAPAAFPVQANGYLLIQDRDAAGNPRVLSNSTVAVIISYGPDGAGAFTITGTQNAGAPAANVDEAANIFKGVANPPVSNALYWARSPTDNAGAAGGAFAHLVMYLNADSLLFPLYQANLITAPQNATTAALAANGPLSAAKSVAMAWMLNEVVTTPGGPCSVPFPITMIYGGNPTLIPNDPWGNPVSMQQLVNPFRWTTPAGNQVMAMISNGPNGVYEFPAGDDIAVYITSGELQTFLIGSVGYPAFKAACN